MPDIKQVYVDGTTYDIWNTVIIDYGTASATVWNTIKTAYDAGKNVLLKVSNTQSSTLYYRHFYPLVTYAKFSSTSEIFEFRSIGTSKTIRYTLSKSNTSYSWSNGTLDLAPLDSPTLTGTPKVPTAEVGTNTTQIATTAFVKTAIDNIPEIVVDDELSDTSENPVQNKVITDALNNGTFGNLTAGASDNLISDEKISNNAPYLYRPVLNGVGNRAYSKLIGATIANNQLIQNWNFADSTGWSVVTATLSISNNIATVTPTAQYGSLINRTLTWTQGHKYLILAEVKGDSEGVTLSCYNSGGAYASHPITTTTNWAPYAAMFNITGATAQRNLIFQDNRASGWDSWYFKAVTFHDLTADFGSTIADYAYTLETGEAGAGVAWLKSYGFFGKYAPYDAGSLISTKAEKKKVVGFNVWDEEWRNGYYSNGAFIASNNYVASTNPTPIIPNTDYYFTMPNPSTNRLGLSFYDAEMSFISARSVNLPNGQLVTTPSNAYFIQFYMDTAYGTTYKNDICINISKTTGTPKNGDYVAHTSQEYDLGSDELRGLFKLDANNNIYADGDIKTSDGQITRKYGTLTFDGSDDELWTLYGYGGLGIGVSTVKQSANQNVIPNIIAEGFVAESYNDMSSNANNMAVSAHHLTQAIIFYNSAITSVDGWRTALASNPITVVFELATPTTEQGTPFVDPSIVYPNGTEEYIDTRTVPVPVGNEMEYTEDLKEGLETILDTPTNDGNYVLKAIVSGGVATLSWVAQ